VEALDGSVAAKGVCTRQRTDWGSFSVCRGGTGLEQRKGLVSNVGAKKVEWPKDWEREGQIHAAGERRHDNKMRAAVDRLGFARLGALCKVAACLTAAKMC
jgi:hypothetical protein